MTPSSPSGARAPRVYLVVGAAAAALLLLGSATAWFVFRPEVTDYALYSDEDYAIRYPDGWNATVEGADDLVPDGWSMVVFTPEEESLELQMRIGSYEPAERDAHTELATHWEGVVEERGLRDQSREEFEASDYIELPSNWDTVLLEDTYTGMDFVAEEQGWQDPERFSVALQVHVERDGRLRAYWAAWYGRQSERAAYGRIIAETLASFQLHV